MHPQEIDLTSDRRARERLEWLELSAEGKSPRHMEALEIQVQRQRAELKAAA